MKKNLILKGLLAATMLTTVSVGTAHAAGTSAGTPISNEFTLNYKANNIDQTQIDNSDDPTVFVVDRRIDLTTAGPSGDTDTTPGTTTESFEFTFVNEGNGSDDFVFEVADNGGTVTASSPTVVSYWVDVDGNGTQGGPGEETVEYTAGSAVEIDPDLTVHVNTTAEIPADASNGETGSLLFTATAVDSSGDALTSDTENTLDGEEIVLDDGQGVADGVNPDAIHTSSATFTILAPDLTATKTAAVVSTDGSGCDAFTQAADTANEFAIPGACVEYTITVSNAASTGTVTVADATDIELTDILEANLVLTALTDAGLGGDFDALTIPATGLVCDGTDTTCNIVYSDGSLAPGETGTVTIRALVDAT